jgi:hypothetical protein
VETRIFLSYTKRRDETIATRLQLAAHNVQISKVLSVIEDGAFYRASDGLPVLKVHDAGN